MILKAIRNRTLLILGLVLVALLTGGCTALGFGRQAPPTATQAAAKPYTYTIGPGDELNIFVWRNPDVSVNNVPVRPDGKISVPLVEDLPVSGKTPSQVAREIEKVLSAYIKDPLVTVTVTKFVGGFNEQVRVVGEATKPQALPYRRNMTLLDVMIAVGGLTDFAAGNKAAIIRKVNGKRIEIPIRLDDLMKDGDMSANMKVRPGDIIFIPESWF